MRQKRSPKKVDAFTKKVGHALERSAMRARETARAYGTPIYIWKDGKVVARKP